MANSKCIKIEDDGPMYSLDHFCVPRHYEDSLDAILIPHGLILNRVERIARDIYEDFKGDSIIVLCILKGGFRFCQDLMDFIKSINRKADKTLCMHLDFLRLKSYVNDKSNGEVEISENKCLEDLKGKNVVVVEDIIDTGKTMKKLLEILNSCEPKCVKVASLILKRRPNSTGYRAHYSGFEVPNKFLVGYALDYNENFRDMDHIGVISDKGKQKYAL